MSRTRKLDPIEIRVLGALMEKEQTTPDQYPLTINAVIAACNQKTNRDPVMSLTETEVVECLDLLREDVLVWRTQSARSERWQHSLDRRWSLDKRSKAIMTVLLLRGPQTVGELRTRTERMVSFESVEEVEETLAKLAAGFDALVCELGRRPGQRETRWMHLESSAGDPRQIYDTAPATSAPAPATGHADSATRAVRDASEPEHAHGPVGRRTPYDERLESLESAVGELKGTASDLRSSLSALQSTVSTIHEQLQSLRSDLGVD